MTRKPRIVLLHGTPVAMEPIQRSFATRWPEADIVNLLDDSLSADRAKDHDLTPRMFERFVELGDYAKRIGADAILVTCSAFGPAIERMSRELPFPVLKPNEAMFREAIGKGRKIGMLATFAPSLVTMTEEFDQFVRETGSGATLHSIVV
ncbi:MAG: arylsulfatase, partial [Proteobacteria bacterium]|nr:arylsulfatase [Pseudomonadota bacterium]